VAEQRSTHGILGEISRQLVHGPHLEVRALARFEQSAQHPVGCIHSLVHERSGRLISPDQSELAAARRRGGLSGRRWQRRRRRQSSREESLREGRLGGVRADRERAASARPLRLLLLRLSGRACGGAKAV